MPVQLAPPLVDLKMFERSLAGVAGLGTAASAYITVRLAAPEAMVMRPTPSVSVMPVALVQVAPLSVEVQTWPSVVPVVAAWFASRLIATLLPPPYANDHT